MSISVDKSSHLFCGELREGDCLAWLRIERSLRGMRWWMLLSALAAVLFGGFLIAGGTIGIAEVRQPERQLPWQLIVAAGLFVAAGVSLEFQAIAMIMTMSRIRSHLKGRQLLAPSLRAYAVVWFWAAAFALAKVILIGVMIVIRLVTWQRL